MTTDSTRWRTSSYSGSQGGNCVEVGTQDRRVLIRDTKNQSRAVLQVPPAAWRAFIAQVKADV